MKSHIYKKGDSPQRKTERDCPSYPQTEIRIPLPAKSFNLVTVTKYAKIACPIFRTYQSSLLRMILQKKGSSSNALGMGTEVKILGKTFEVKSQFDPDFTIETANLVNTKMNELAGKAQAISTEKVAILAAMNIAGDYLRLIRSETNRRSALIQKIEKIVSYINEKEQQYEKQREFVEARK